LQNHFPPKSIHIRGDNIIQMMDLQKAKKQMDMLTKVAVLLWLIGFLLVLGAIFREFFGDKSDDPDDVASRVLLTMKLGGIGFTLAAIFLTLLVIIKALTMMP